MKPVVLILAGGRSRRMAPLDKLQLRHSDGEPMLRRVVRCVPRAGLRRVVAPRARWEALQALDLQDVEWVEDEGRGPMQAVVRAAKDLSPAAFVLIVPADLARPRPSLFARLIAADSGEGAFIAGPEGFLLPMIASGSRIQSQRDQTRLSALMKAPGMVRLRWRDLPGGERSGTLDVDHPSVARSQRLACRGIPWHR